MKDKAPVYPTSQRMQAIASRNGQPNAAAVAGQKAAVKPAAKPAQAKPAGGCSCNH